MLYFGKHKLMAIKLACYWAILFVLPLTNANTTVVCNDTYSNTQGLQCFPCSPGYTKKDDCRTNQTLAQCTQCNEGTYQPHCISANETGECRNCTSCAVYIQNCTIYHDAVCGWSNNVKEGTSEGNGFLVLMLPLIWLFAVLVFGCAFVFCQYRYRQRWKQVSNNKWNNVVDREMHTDYNNPSGRSKGDYMCTNTTKKDLACSLDNTEISPKRIDSTIGKVPTIECLFGTNEKKKDHRGSTPNTVDVHVDGSSTDRYTTGSLGNIRSSFESINSNVGKVPAIECLFGENYEKKDSRGFTPNIVDVHVDGSFPDRYTTDKSQVSKTEDVSKGNTNKLATESKLIAVISPVQGAVANKCHSVEGNFYGGQQLTRERLQLSGGSENTPKEKKNNKGPTNNVTSPSHAENRIVHVKEPAESDEKGAANTEIDWIKLFRDIVPHLPIDDCSWTFFAIDLLHISHEQCGLPKNVSNEMNKIKQNNKQLDLAYLELLNIWYSMMGSEASLEHIESALKRLDNKVIMEEFERIKDNPPTRKIFAQKTETSLMPWRKNEQIPLAQRPLFVYAQHESTHEIAETHDLLSHTEDGHFVQLTNFSATSQTQTSQSFLSDPSRLVRQKVQQRSKEKYYDNDPYHKVRWRGSKNKKRSSRRKSKMKKKLKMAEEMRKLETENSSLKNENITLIKTILPFDKIRLSRQQYNTFVDYTVNKIMEHNHVSRKTVLSITYEAYTEIAETKNGGRYILYSGSPNLNLDKDQYDYLVFYVKFARTRVLKEIEELQGNGDTLFLFITYDGKSALELYQRQSRLKKRRNPFNLFESDYSSSSNGSSSSETESSDVHDMETGEGLRSQMSTSLAYSTMYDNPVNNDLRVETYPLPAISENNKSPNNGHTVSIQQNDPISKRIDDKRKHNEETDENHGCNDNEVITVVKGLPESRCFEEENEMSAECLPVEENINKEISESFRMHNRDIANHNSGVQENESVMSFEDLMRDIDKELECTTSV